MSDSKTDPPPSREENTSRSHPRVDLSSWGSEDRLQNLANLLAVIVALAAIGLAVWQGLEQRKFYRLSMMPHLEGLPASARFDTAPNSKYFPLVSAVGTDSLYAISYSVQNSGLGPAELQRFVVFKNDKRIFDSRQPDSTNTNPVNGIDCELEELPFHAELLQGTAAYGGLLKAGEVHPFLEVAIPFSGIENADSLDRSPMNIVKEDVLNTRNFVFCYCSVYGTDCDMAVLGGEPPVENACGY